MPKKGERRKRVGAIKSDLTIPSRVFKGIGKTRVQNVLALPFIQRLETEKGAIWIGHVKMGFLLYSLWDIVGFQLVIAFFSLLLILGPEGERHVSNTFPYTFLLLPLLTYFR